MIKIKLPPVIGLCGRMYSGKTTVAEHLVKTHGYKKLAFADALKQMLITAGMCTHDECYGKKTEQSRWLLQKVGTEIFRRQVHPDFWVQRTARALHEILATGERVVIDDIRFPNEARLIKSYVGKGMLVKLTRVNADGTPWRQRGFNSETDEHDSERNVDDIEADCELTAGSGDVNHLFDGINHSLTLWRQK